MGKFFELICRAYESLQIFYVLWNIQVDDYFQFLWVSLDFVFVDEMTKKVNSTLINKLGLRVTFASVRRCNTSHKRASCSA